MLWLHSQIDRYSSNKKLNCFQIPINDYKTPFYLLKKSRVSPTCTVVHCSAGVGRSGTLVAIELCLMQLLAGNELVVPDMVAFIRQKRAQSVQTKEQYLYIFRFASPWKKYLHHSNALPSSCFFFFCTAKRK